MKSLLSARRHALLGLAFAIAMPWHPAQGQAQAQASTPDALVRSLSNDVLEAIKSDPSLKGGDIDKLNQLVDQKILPYVDFEKMTQLAVGRGWRQANPEQRAALTREFRSLLVRTYAGAVSQITDHKVEMKPFRAAANANEAIVRTAVVPSRGEAIQLDYRVEKANPGWKIYDVNVAGVWLVENYRNSFASEINQGGIDGLIKALTERNRQLASKKS